MKYLLTPVRLLASLLLMGWWGGAMAQSLGRATGEAWMGRPLEMSVPARFAGSAPDDECVRAEVFFADQRVPASAVRASVVGTDTERRVRVTTTALIDEPVVTVSLRAGCRNTVTRSYTLLPELPSEEVIAGLVRRQQAAGVRPAAGKSAAPVRVAAAARPAPAAARAAPRPRLQLEPLVLDDRPLLRVSAVLAEPAGDAARRATAALLWQALNAGPQEVLRTSAMLQQLEADLAQLRAGSGQSRAEIEALRRRLDAAPSGWLSPVLASALALLLLAAAAAGLSWRRARRAQVTEPWPVAVPEAEAAAVPAWEEEVHVAPEEPAEPPVVAAPPQRASGGLLRVETLAATFEEVDFLSSLGLVHDAIDVLKAYIRDSAGPSPIAFLELMRLCEVVDDRSGAALVRRRYADQFRVDAPRLDQATAPRALDAWPELATRITRAWARREAADLIEALLFVAPPAGPALTLQAGRDLLTLHDLARALAADAAAAPREVLAPWADVEDAGAVQAITKAMAEEQGGDRFALDIDVGAAPAPLPPSQEPPDLVPLLAEVRRAAARDAARRAQQEEVDAFSAAVARERVPVSRF